MTDPDEPDSEVSEKLRALVFEHGMMAVLNALPPFFAATYDTHDLSTLTHVLDARDSYRLGYRRYHYLLDQNEDER